MNKAKTITAFDEKKFDQEMDKWAKNNYKNKLVNLFVEKPIQFDKKTVYKTMEKLNSGKEVNKKTLVKMLYQLQYTITEYQSLVHSLSYFADEAKIAASRHAKTAYLD